jgi:predicted DNA-binding helix-hairpin-helix protein
MFSFTRQERMVVVCLMTIIATGASLHFLFKRYPQLKDMVNLMDTDVLYPKVDLNTASHAELVAIPYIGDYTARNIIRYREGRQGFRSLQELKKVKGIRDKNYQKFIRYLRVIPPRQ